MASTSNKLWKYNRYRYIMTYQERPWLPPPLIVLSHMTLALRVIYRRCKGDAEREERGTGLKLLLGHEDRKKLHEFEEKCVQAYFHERSDGQDSSQINRIRATAERTEEMCTMAGEVSDKVNFIQNSLSDLDGQLGHLQDLSALAVDTLTLLSASDSRHQEEARLAQCRPVAASRHILPHSWTLPHRSGADCDVLNVRRIMAKSCKSMPPSLLKSYTWRASQECHVGARGSRGGRQGHAEETEEGPKEEESSMEEEEEGKEEEEEEEEEEEQGEERKQEDLSDTEVSKTSSNAALLSDPQDISEGLVNPAFTDDDGQPGSRSRPFSQWGRPVKPPRWACMSRDRPYGYCRSLSSSVENITFSGTPLSPMRGSFSSLNEPMSKEDLTSCGRSFRDDTSLQCSGNREWSRSSDFTHTDSRGKNQNRKTVKIQESSPHTAAMQSHLSDACWRRCRWLRGEARCWSASTSLNQLNFEPMDLLQKQMFSHQDMWSPTHSAWNSWAISMSRRSSLQSGVAPEVKSSPFQSTENLYPHYSAMERNNLMRLAHNIPFTPVSIMGGEEVSIYSLEEVPSDADPESNTASSWSSRGLSAMLQPLSSEEGSLDGGLRQGCRVLCTWAEQNVLKPGLVYVVKAFRSEVVRAWQRYFHGSTALQLCLREIQQQRAAQKMMQVFNQVKPDDMHHSPRFLDVSLVLWHSNGQWLTIERNMSGDFRKYNNNTGEEIVPCCSLEEMLLAFSHWTYEYSCRELVVLDIQGVGETLTDPTVIMADDQSGSRGEMLFGPDNLGDAAVNSFLQKHSCSACCRRLGLTDLRKRPDSCENSSEA